LRFLLHILAMFAVALIVGFGLSYYALTDGRLVGALTVGPWAAWPQAGTKAPDPYTRAHMARVGELQLGQSEGLQFIADRDSDGRPLDRTCTYRIAGNTPLASFWTLTAETADGLNVARPGTPISMQSNRIARAQDGSIIINVGPALAPMNWLEITGTGPFSLVLTLYDVSALGGAGSGIETMPAVTREDCA
jgi:hypothetical protein